MDAKSKVSITSPYEQCTLEKFRTGDKIIFPAMESIIKLKNR